MSTSFIFLNATRSPFSDIAVRRALALAIDRRGAAGRGVDLSASGGFVPPGMPGHTADIALNFDVAQARALLAQAGHPDGRGFPRVTAWQFGSSPAIQAYSRELQRQWRQNLGIEVEFVPQPDWGPDFLAEADLVHTVWAADFPDPDNFLRTASYVEIGGWRHLPRFERLVNEARIEQDHSTRLRMYAAAERIAVNEEAVIIPLKYGRRQWLCKPWVKASLRAIDSGWFKDTVLEPH